MAALLPVLVLVTQMSPAADESAQIALELRSLREHVAVLDAQIRRRDQALDELTSALRTIGSDVAEVKNRTSPPPSAAFIAAPPPSSDAVGVAQTVVLSPRVEADSTRRRDLVSFKIRRVESTALRTVGEVEMGADGDVALPVDQNGALYVVDWTTTDGQTFNLILRDGTSGQAAATVHVKPLQSSGRFVFVGYGLD